MAKKEKIHEAEKDRSERWLLTYSDLITLLLIYFIVMFSMSTINARKFEAVTNSLAIILGSAGRSGILTGGRTTFPTTEESKEKKAMKSTEERINRMIGQMGLAGKITATMTGRGLVISVKDTVFFQRGSADLTSRARDIMETVGRILARMPNSVRIEGHTDNDPIHTPQFFSNWELSTARATNVLQYLVQSVGFPPERLSAAGYGEYKPIVPNTTEANKAQNRRVDIVLLSKSFSQFEPGTGDKISSLENPLAPDITPGTETTSPAVPPPAEAPSPAAAAADDKSIP